MSVDFADVNSAVKARMEANWSHTAVAYENQGFTPENETPFVELYTVERASQRPVAWHIPEVGANRLEGAIYAAVSVPENTGDDALEQYLTLIKALFEGVTFDGATTRIYVQASSAGPAGRKSPWFKKMLIFPLYAVSNPA
jgi:hypothetical protein